MKILLNKLYNQELIKRQHRVYNIKIIILKNSILEGTRVKVLWAAPHTKILIPLHPKMKIKELSNHLKQLIMKEVTDKWIQM